MPELALYSQSHSVYSTFETYESRFDCVLFVHNLRKTIDDRLRTLGKNVNHFQDRNTSWLRQLRQGQQQQHLGSRELRTKIK